MLRSVACFGLLVFVGAVSGCAVSDGSDSPSAASESAVATSSQLVACSTPIGTADGAWIVYAECAGAGGQGRIVRASVGGVQTVARAGSYQATDTLMTIGTTGKYIYWALRHADNTAEFNVATFASTWTAVVTTIPLERGWREPLQNVVINDDGDIGFIGYFGGIDQKLFVGKVGTAEPVLIQPLPYESLRSYTVWGAPHSRAMLVSLSGTSKLRVLDLYSSTPTLSDPVEPAMAIQTVFPQTYGGYSYLAIVRSGGMASLASVQPKSGTVQVLAGPFQQISDVADTGTHLVYAGQKMDGTWAIESLKREYGASPRTLATDPDLFWFRLSHDRSSIAFRGGPERSSAKPNWLGVVAVDGATPANVVVPATENLELSLDRRSSPGASRFLLGVKDRSSRAESIRLLDEGTGFTLGSWSKDIDYEYDFTVKLSADGQVLYAPKPCDSGRGEMITELWPGPTNLTACRANRSEDLLPIPNSSAMMLAGRNDARTVTIFRP
jgi:hypothetical protein